MYFSVNLIKYAQDWYEEYHKTVRKMKQRSKNIEETFHAHE